MPTESYCFEFRNLRGVPEGALRFMLSRYVKQLLAGDSVVDLEDLKYITKYFSIAGEDLVDVYDEITQAFYEYDLLAKLVNERGLIDGFDCQYANGLAYLQFQFGV